MASCTKVYEVRIRLKNRKAGRKRKNKLEREGTTPRWDVLFGDVAAAASAETSATES